MKYIPKTGFNKKVTDLNTGEVSSAPVYTEVIVLNSPSEEHSVVNKKYVDSLLSETKYSVGDIKITSYEESTPGFLKCNGSYVDKTAYPELYNKIQDRFTQNLLIGSGNPCNQQYYVNSSMQRELYFWSASANLPSNCSYFNLIATKNRVYLLGRNSNAASENTVYTAVINSDGSLGTWITGTSLPIKLSNSNVAIIKGNVYLLGGYTTTGISSIYRSTINADGTLGTWGYYGSLPFTLYNSTCIVTTNKIYIIGGVLNGATTNRIYYCDVDSLANIEPWIQGPDLPEAVSSHKVTLVRDRVYVIGGANSSKVSVANVYYSTISSDGILGNWSYAEKLPIGIKDFSLYVSKNRVYIIGGWTTKAANYVYSSGIESDGSIKDWTQYGVLPAVFYAGGVVCTSSYLYYICGKSSTSDSRKIYKVSSSGALNDYTSYNTGSFVNANINLFGIPDYTNQEVKNLYYYIKT